MKKQFHLQDIILIAMIAIIFGAIFVGTDYLYNVLFVAVGPFANEILFGLWIMAGPLAIYLTRIPGSAIVGEVLGAAAEVIFGGTFGISALLSGIVQGVGSELGFTVYRYRRWDWVSLLTSSVTTTIVAFGYELFRLGYVHYSLGMIAALFAVRLVSVIFFGTIMVRSIFGLLDRAHALRHVHS
ncbi:ECF transporter S component [Secundilactobacillus similis]|uniref:ABC superfamily ATP binding cassette transporter subunit n=1 Tax=Secundilactobacillus similis DSM 23365 = JCM 2765 TaxID=1423804 RepID=A0A0R2F2J1_9LACO|nr:ECF transporter S component [Secundilactobacillus similis]KRN18532.1 ABC superfamily ATP binding cassette transporter subunit [Secundilactobacillus similis DSM 23365 = JCM 2765]